jgi:thiol-disulfide isomerase/thioredoxin
LSKSPTHFLTVLLATSLAIPGCGSDDPSNSDAIQHSSAHQDAASSTPPQPDERGAARPSGTQPNAAPSEASGPSPEVSVQPVAVKRISVGSSGEAALNSPVKGTSRKGQPKRWLGLAVANLKEPIPQAPANARAMIQRAHRGGPGHRAGLRRGDVIVAAEGQPVLRYQDYIAQARLKEIGDTLALEVLRDGQPLQFEVGLIEKPRNSKVWRRQHFPGSAAFSWDIPKVRPLGRVHDTRTSLRPQLIYFWATWCGPCRRTSPEVDRLYRDAGGRVDVIAVSSEERDVIEGYLKRGSTTYPVAHDDEGRLKLDYEVQSLPTIVWLEGDKVVAWDYGIAGVQRVVSSLRTQLDI